MRTTWGPILLRTAGKMSAAPHGAFGLISEELVAGVEIVGSDAMGPEPAGWEAVSVPPAQRVANTARSSAPDTNKSFTTSAPPCSRSSGPFVSPRLPPGNAHTTPGDQQALAILAVGNGSPQAKNFQIPPRQAPGDAQALFARARRVPAVPSAEAAPSRLPDLRHV
jgi:hypothetical protein